MTALPDTEMLARAERFANQLRAEADGWAKQFFPTQYTPAYAATLSQWVKENLPATLQEHATAELNRVFVVRPGARG